jgi:hypothetical protein
VFDDICIYRIVDKDSRFVKYGVELGRDKHGDMARKSTVISVDAIKAGGSEA